MKKSLQISAFVLLSVFSSIYAQYSLNVSVLDSISGEFIPGAKGELREVSIIKSAGDDGKLLFNNLKSGHYLLRIRAEDYFSKEVSVEISDKPVTVAILLASFESSVDTIDVRAKYFNRDETVSTSYTNTFNEEIRKTPGVAEDIIRFFNSSPGVSIGWDQYNEIIARGGSPVENLTIIDGLEILNPNHYATPGSTGGVLSFINLKMVKDIDFFTGGFPPKFGTRLSSVLDIKLKDVTGKRHYGDVYVAMTGFGIYAEGPVTKKSSYMFSARRSYLEFVKEHVDMPLLPEFWDFNLKINYYLSHKDKLSLVGLFAIDNAFPYEKKRDFWNDTIRVKILGTGINYEKTGNRYSLKFTSGYNLNYYKVQFEGYYLDINDNEAYLKQEASVKLNYFTNLEFYAAEKYIFSKYKIWRNGGFNSSNYYSPYLNFDADVNTYKLAAGANLNFSILKKKLTLNFGLRFDKFGYITESFTVSPRLGLSHKLAKNTFVNLSYGIYYQAPELLWVISNESNKSLRSIKSDSYVIGVDHYFSDDLRLNCEVYLKQYLLYPVSVYDPNFIFINSGVDLVPNFLDEARSAGKGFITGVDVSFQKRNAGPGLYWTLNYSYSKSKFLAIVGNYQQGEFDYGHQLTAILGYKLPMGLSFSGRFKYAGRRPYTPYDEYLSETYDRGIYDKSKYNKGRMPEYIRLDLRVDQYVKLWQTELNVYVEVQNMLDRENVFMYYWSYIDHSVHSNNHWTILPLLGISYKF